MGQANTTDHGSMSKQVPKLERTVLLIEWPDRRDFGEKHKGKIIGGVVGGVAGAIALPIALPLLGFTATGVAAGSAAAGIQSVVYGAFTTGLFSMAQSMGAVGVSAGVTAFMAAGAGAVGFRIGTMASVGTSRQKELLRKLNKTPESIHIYPDKLYIKSNSPIHKTIPTQKLREETLLDGDQHVYDFDIIYKNRQFTYRNEEIIETNIDFSRASLWIYRFELDEDKDLDVIRKSSSKINIITTNESQAEICDRVMKLFLKDVFNITNFTDLPYYSYCIHGYGYPQPNSDLDFYSNKNPSMLPVMVPYVGFKQGLINNNDSRAWLESIDQYGPLNLHYQNPEDNSEPKNYISIKHKTSENIGISGSVSITPNSIEDKNYVGIDKKILKLKNQSIPVLIYKTNN